MTVISAFFAARTPLIEFSITKHLLGLRLSLLAASKKTSGSV